MAIEAMPMPTTRLRVLAAVWHLFAVCALAGAAEAGGHLRSVLASRDGTKLCGGSTAPGATAWRLGLRHSLTVRVRATGCETLGLWRTPQYFFTVLSDADYTAGSRVPVVVEARAHAVYGNASRISAVVLQADPHGFTAAVFVPFTASLRFLATIACSSHHRVRHIDREHGGLHILPAVHQRQVPRHRPRQHATAQ